MTERNTAGGSQAGERQSSRTPPAGARGPNAAVVGRGAKRADPTEPEVPSAKRVRAVRRQRSLVVAGSAVLFLVAIVVSLLYKMGRRVTTLPPATSAAAESIDSTPQAAPSHAVEPAPVRPIEPPMATAPTTASQPPPAAAPGSKGPTGMSAPRAKASAQATDIFRRPAF